MRKRVADLPRGLVFLWVFLFAVWLVINASVELPVVASGALVSLVLSWIFVRRTDVWRIEMTPGKALHFLAYTGVFCVEMVKANIEMIRYVYAPRIDIRPGIVKINVRLRSPIGRVALANSIALTPGSLVMDITDDAMFIHWLDVKTTDPEKATGMIAGPFEKHLGAVFG
ncbi:Na+/H+ antiporter subunit E [Sinorhizobium sp. RAC02]|uniref:Na+/H+ antiporter subunit E n=1 Tax=Sinorhizobium sp. RAC02 TaxID=1842534 RepID=UPI000858C0BF|nr:Na+/H+ antiporter subunit E [Sinorhizobium sp. RAC02]AOF91652.1 na+/H+ ion antiporter subunit [Sinorhizobium sp. RAC02]